MRISEFGLRIDKTQREGLRIKDLEGERGNAAFGKLRRVKVGKIESEKLKRQKTEGGKFRR